MTKTGFYSNFVWSLKKDSELNIPGIGKSNRSVLRRTCRAFLGWSRIWTSKFWPIEAFNKALEANDIESEVFQKPKSPFDGYGLPYFGIFGSC